MEEKDDVEDDFEENLLHQISEKRKLLVNDDNRDRPESPVDYLNYNIGTIPIYINSKRKHKFISFLENESGLKIKSVFLQPLYTIGLDSFLDVCHNHNLNLTENILEKIINDLCKGLYFLHYDLEWIHYDIKPQNIMLTINNRTIIATYIDYGFSRPVDHDLGNVSQGTRPYMAPELLRKNTHGVFSDIWALGIVYCEILLYKHDNRKWYTQFTDRSRDIVEIFLSYMKNNGVKKYYNELFLNENIATENITINEINKAKHAFLDIFLEGENYNDRKIEFKEIFRDGIKDTKFEFNDDDKECIKKIRSMFIPAPRVLPSPGIITQELGGKKKSKKRKKRTKRTKKIKRRKRTKRKII